MGFFACGRGISTPDTLLSLRGVPPGRRGPEVSGFNPATILNDITAIP